MQEMEVIRVRQTEGGHDGTTRSKRGWDRGTWGRVMDGY